MAGAGAVRRQAYREDLTQAGVAYTLRQLHRLGARRHNLDFNALRQAVAEKAAELALIRLLGAEGIPHEVSAARSLASQASGIRLGGRVVFLHTELVNRPRDIEALETDPNAHGRRALAINEAILEDGQALEGVHVFARLLGTVSKGPREIRTPHTLVIPLEGDWARPPVWRPLGPLAFKLERGEDLDLEVGGLDAERRFRLERLRLAAGQRQTIEPAFYALSYLQAGTLPFGRLGVSSPSTGLRQLAAPKHWGNLWIYGQGIAWLGYLPGRHLLGLRRRTRPLPGKDLRPLADLFQRASRWAAQAGY